MRQNTLKLTRIHKFYRNVHFSLWAVNFPDHVTTVKSSVTLLLVYNVQTAECFWLTVKRCLTLLVRTLYMSIEMCDRLIMVM